MACSLQGGSGSRNASPALVLRPPWPPRRCESGASSRLQCRAARKPRAASCLAAAQRMATTDNRPQASTSKGAASSKRKSTPQCHTQRAASALNIKAASQGGPRINHPPRSLHWAYTATPGGDHLHGIMGFFRVSCATRWCVRLAAGVPPGLPAIGRLFINYKHWPL